MILEMRKKGQIVREEGIGLGWLVMGRILKERNQSQLYKVLSLVLENGRVSDRNVKVREQPLWGQSIYIWGAVLFSP